MKKIISLFQRNYDGDKLVRNEVVPGAEWVVHGEGVATCKLDGTCCMVREGKLYKRYELKAGKQAPVNFEAAQAPDIVTGNIPGWVLVGNDPSDIWHNKAWELAEGSLPDGTYELCGPKIQGNIENYSVHTLVPHGRIVLEDCPRNFDDLREYLRQHNIEGIVWHHPDGRMVKIKGKDFGIKRGAK